ncbi:MAG: hypothetical protein HFI90_10560 [Clostridia bacterium]|nr:hypothetical protein [Clostridia bacterium]
MPQHRKELERIEKPSAKTPREIKKIEIEDIDDLIFRDGYDIKTHSER